MDIYILRHGIAEDRSPAGKGDFDRALTKEGIQRMKAIARGMRKAGVKVERVVTSPALRALETARIAAEALGNPPLEEAPVLYEGDSRAILRHLQEHRKETSLLVVGHEPTLHEIASLWISGTEALDIELKKAGLIRLEVPSWGARQRATLKWLLGPRHLEALA